MKNLKRIVGLCLLMAAPTLLTMSCSDSVQEIVEATNSALPANVGNGLYATSVVLDGDIVCWYYDVDETIFGYMNRIGAARVKEDFINIILVEDPLLSAVIDENKSIAYVLTNRVSGDDIAFEITPEELRRIK